MKQVSLLFATLLLSVAVSAQSPSITNVIASSLTGRTINAHFVGAPTFDEGNAGAAQTWDFSSYSFPSASSSSYVNPFTAYGYSNFTTCTDALRAVNGATTSFTFDKLSGNVYSLIGLSQTGPQANTIIVYDNYQDIYRFPMTFGNAFTDDFHGTADYGSGVTLGRGGSITALVDGYGTLKTPAGTFTNTLRIKLTQTLTDTFYISGSPYDEQETNTVSYNWVAQSHPGLTLMNISSGQGPFQAIDYAFYVDGTTTGIDEMANDKIQFSIFPNPSNGIIHLNFAEYLPNATISLFDVTGREVYTKQVTDISETIQVQEMPSGIYLLKVSSENLSVSRRVVIE